MFTGLTIFSHKPFLWIQEDIQQKLKLETSTTTIKSLYKPNKQSILKYFCLFEEDNISLRYTAYLQTYWDQK